jgi:peptidoglycan/xylan/chitin deacetylase (PgdA/CDA1 family)
VQGAAQALTATVRTAARGQPVYRLGAWPGDKTWAAATTHDLDLVSGWPVAAGLRWLELLGRGELGRAVSAMGSALGGALASPVRRTIAGMLQLEQELGIRSTWFVLAGEPTFAGWRRGDITYRLDGPAGRRIIEMLVAAGHEVGLHGSFVTRDDAELMAAQRDRVTRVSGKAPEGVRQHFLRFDPGRTPAGASRAGFRYDASHGFSDRNAFRLGLADVVPLWQAATGEPVRLEEAPLVWMDRTHTKYRREEDPRRWVEDALRLATLCREAGGLWTGLWHPNVAPALGFPGTTGTLGQLLRGILDQNPWVAPLGEIVAWRTARRGLRGRPGSAGRVELQSERTGEWPVTLEELTSGSTARHRWPEVRRG